MLRLLGLVSIALSLASQTNAQQYAAAPGTVPGAFIIELDLSVDPTVVAPVSSKATVTTRTSTVLSSATTLTTTSIASAASGSFISYKPRPNNAGGPRGRRPVAGAAVAAAPSASTKVKRAVTQAIVKQSINAVMARAQNAGVPIQNIRQSFDSNSDLFAGFSVDTNANFTAVQLAAIPGVKNVWPVQIYKKAPGLDSSGSVPSPGLKKRLSDAYEFVQHETRATAPLPPDVQNSHVVTGVSHSQAAGQIGTGISICLVDEGIDYKHPLLGGCYGTGCKVAKGYDFVGDTYPGPNINPYDPPPPAPVPDNDPYGTCTAGATYRAGVAAALALPQGQGGLGISGVAPGATLGAYRIFSCVSNSIPNDILMQALIRATNDGCNVISPSSTYLTGWTDSLPVAQLINRIEFFQNVMVVDASGDGGKDGLFLGQTQGDASTTTVAGAVYPAEVQAWPATLTIPGSSAVYSFIYQALVPQNVQLPIKFWSTNPSATDDACNAAQAGSLKGVVVWIQQATACTLETQVANAKTAGAQYLLVFNNAASSPLTNLDNYTGANFTDFALIAGVMRMQALKAMSLYAAGVQTSSPVTMSASSTNVVLQAGYPLRPGIASLQPAYAQYGPQNDGFAYVAAAAPMGVLSASPNNKLIISYSSVGSYPFMAGAAAVVMAARANDNLNPLQIRSLLSTTGKLIYRDNSNSAFNTAAQQGGGLIQVDKAIAAKTIISPDRFNLNDSANFNSVQTLRLQNRNPFPVTYTLTQTDGVTLAHFKNSYNDILPNPSPDIVSGGRPGIKFSQSTITVASGVTGVVTLTFSQPTFAAADADKFPVYSGYVTIAGDQSQTYYVQYTGIYGTMSNLHVLDTTTIASPGPAYPFMLDASFQPTTQTQTYKYGAGPTFLARFAFGSRFWAADLVPPNFQFTPTIPSPGFQSSRMTKRSLRSRAGTLYSSVGTLGQLLNGTAWSRDTLYYGGGVSSEKIPFAGYTPDKKVMVPPNIPFHVLVRVLKVNMDPLYEDSYESWVSPGFIFTQ